ncbi:rhodanese-like domain-containing protein [Reinekea marina]|uniref:Rhodanese-like domain-containing protein n=1 Tax=Reinekea marina TaxID=1310421 RepID=A0ABV7WNF1_9GAMM|nr:rhodanese-like domain-containing protein [Reinekea marina]MDN3648583.1 rhodanese-like domain-containing protein [Reinekea marina]
MQHLIDVRSPAEYQQGHAQGAINVPVDQLAIQLSNGMNLEKTESITVYCLSGGRAGVAKTLLERAGFSNVTNAGGVSNLM